MNNTKTIFKSLLIMIVAISLFTVSCSKDEGGTKPPTTPAKPITITAQSITEALTQIPDITISKTKISFKSINAGNTITVTGTADASATGGISKKEDLQFSALTINGATVDASVGDFNITDKADIIITITITPTSGNSFAATDSLKPYTATDGKVTVRLTLKPQDTKKWDGQ